jgi:hypothetical protein
MTYLKQKTLHLVKGFKTTTYSPTVPSAQAGLTTLFGMGRSPAANNSYRGYNCFGQSLFIINCFLNRKYKLIS